jgi:ketosteroid isomerase-like protein
VLKDAGRALRRVGHAVISLLPASVRWAIVSRLPGSWASAGLRIGMRGAYEYTNRTGRLDPRVLDPEIEWMPPPSAPQDSVYRGREGAVAELGEWTELFDDFRWEPQEFVEAGDRHRDWIWVVAGRMSGRGKASGARTEVDEFHVWTFRRGTAVRLAMYLDRADAFRAAGIDR